MSPSPHLSLIDLLQTHVMSQVLAVRKSLQGNIINGQPVLSRPPQGIRNNQAGFSSHA